MGGSVPWILGVERLLHPTRPCLNVRHHTEPSSHKLRRFFLVDTRPEHQDVSLGVLDVEQEGVLVTRVKQSWNPCLGKLQAVDQFPLERKRIQVSRSDRFKDLGFLSPSQST